MKYSHVHLQGKLVCYNMTYLQHIRTFSIHSVILLTTESVFIITDTVIIVLKSKGIQILKKSKDFLLNPFSECVNACAQHLSCHVV